MREENIEALREETAVIIYNLPIALCAQMCTKNTATNLIEPKMWPLCKQGMTRSMGHPWMSRNGWIHGPAHPWIHFPCYRKPQTPWNHFLLLISSKIATQELPPIQSLIESQRPRLPIPYSSRANLGGCILHNFAEIRPLRHNYAKIRSSRHNYTEIHLSTPHRYSFYWPPSWTWP